LTETTHKAMLKALHQMMSELSKWLTHLGLSEMEMISIHDAAMRENGMLAKIVTDRTRAAIPEVGAQSANAEAGPAMAWVRSPEFPSVLLRQPEPSPEELRQFLDGCKNGLARVRQEVIDSSEGGPPRKRGKGPKKIEGPAKRDSVRQETKDLRDSGVLLKDIDRRVGQRYGVSGPTIKRIRLEKPSLKKSTE
jgi:hypothetical protein